MNPTAEQAVPDRDTNESFWGDSHAESAMALLINDISLDAAFTPEAYLRETIVPEGGE